MYSRCAIVVFALLHLPAILFAATFDPAPLVEKAAKYLEQGDVLESADTWAQIYGLSSDSELRAQALVRQGDIAALFQSDPDTALQLYDRALHEFPESAAVENAYFNAAMLRYGKGDAAAAAKGFSAYRSRFPKGAHAQTASYMLERIKGEGAPVPAPETVREASEPVVRVRLELADVVTLSAPHGGHLLFPDGSWESVSQKDFRFSVSAGRHLWDDRELGGQLTLLPEGGSFLWHGHRYPGEASLRAYKGRVLLVNRLPLETYLWGVVPAEMPASFAQQALRAQAVASRSYAAALLRGTRGKPWDLLASRLSQVYKGVRAGDARIRDAVESTHGQVLLYDGNPILSYFHAHSGGMLEDDAAVWNGDLPFYTARNDAASQEAKDLQWEVTVSYADLAAALEREGYKVGRIRRVYPLSHTSSGRLETIGLGTDHGEERVQATVFRRVIGTARMKSTLCELESNVGHVVITGQGFGHGVGMSQWGAQGLAADGVSYDEILSFYYPGVALEKLW